MQTKEADSRYIGAFSNTEFDSAINEEEKNNGSLFENIYQSVCHVLMENGFTPTPKRPIGSSAWRNRFVDSP